MLEEENTTDAAARPVYTVIRTRCETPGAEGAAVYGLRVAAYGGCIEFPDIDASPRRVEELTRRLAGLDIAPCHLADIVSDYIEELAGG